MDEEKLDASQKKVRKANETGFLDLVLSMNPKPESGKVMLDMISSAETKELCLKGPAHCMAIILIKILF